MIIIFCQAENRKSYAFLKNAQFFIVLCQCFVIGQEKSLFAYVINIGVITFANLNHFKRMCKICSLNVCENHNWLGCVHKKQARHSLILILCNIFGLAEEKHPMSQIYHTPSKSVKVPLNYKQISLYLPSLVLF